MRKEHTPCAKSTLLALGIQLDEEHVERSSPIALPSESKSQQGQKVATSGACFGSSGREEVEFPESRLGLSSLAASQKLVNCLHDEGVWMFKAVLFNLVCSL